MSSIYYSNQFKTILMRMTRVNWDEKIKLLKAAKLLLNYDNDLSKLPSLESGIRRESIKMGLEGCFPSHFIDRIRDNDEEPLARELETFYRDASNYQVIAQ